MSGRLIGPKTWDQIVGLLEPVFDRSRTVWATYVIIYALNYELGAFGPEMAVDFGSTKWSRCLVSGLPTNSLLLV